MTMLESRVTSAVGRALQRALGSIRRIPWRWAHAVIAVLAFGMLFSIVKDQWFILDEFDYLRPSGNWLVWVLTPHNEHTIVFTKAWYSICYQLFGLRHFWVYALPMLIAHAAAYIAVVRIVILAIGDRPLARFGTLPLIVMAAGVGTLTWGGQFQYTGAVAAGLWLIWGSLREKGMPLWLVAVLTIFGTFSGSAFIALAIVAGVLFVVRARLFAGLIVLILSVGWFLVSKEVWKVSDAYQAQGVRQVLADGPSFAWAVFDRAVTDTTRTPSVTAVLIVATGALAVALAMRMTRANARSPRAMVVYALAAATVLSLLVTVIGRIGRDISDAAGGGYSYFIVITAFPLVLVLVATAIGRSRIASGLVLAFSLVLSAVGVAGYSSYASSLRDWKQGTNLALSNAAYLAAHGTAGYYSALPAPNGAPTVDWATVTMWARDGKIIERKPSSSGQAAILAQVQLSVVGTTAKCAPVASSELSSDGRASTKIRSGARVQGLGLTPSSIELTLNERGATARTIPLATGAIVTVTAHDGGDVRLMVTSGSVAYCE